MQQRAPQEENEKNVMQTCSSRRKIWRKETGFRKSFVVDPIITQETFFGPALSISSARNSVVSVILENIKKGNLVIVPANDSTEM